MIVVTTGLLVLVVGVAFIGFIAVRAMMARPTGTTGGDADVMAVLPGGASSMDDARHQGTHDDAGQDAGDDGGADSGGGGDGGGD